MREKLIEEKKRKIKRWFYGIGIFLFIGVIICLRIFVPLWFKNLSIFSVKNIVVEPPTHSAFIKTYLSIPDSTNILSLNLEEIYSKIKQIYFIEDCFIEKHLPDTLFIQIKIRTCWVIISDANSIVIMDRQGFFLPFQENFKGWNIVGMIPGKIGSQTTESEKLSILKEIEQWYNYYGIARIFPVEMVSLENTDKIELKGSEGCIYIRGDEIRRQFEVIKELLISCRTNNFLFEYIDVRFEQPYIKEKLPEKNQ